LRVAIGLGSNLGSRAAYLSAAIDSLSSSEAVNVVARSALYQTDAVGPPQPRFCNAVVLVETMLPLRALFDRCKQIEHDLGREPGPRWGPRVVDLDLVVADVVHAEPDLAVPHPEAASRAFVLAPLADVWPDSPLSARPFVSPQRVPWPLVEPVDHTADIGLRAVAPDESDLLAVLADGLVDVVLDRRTISESLRVDLRITGGDDGGDTEDRIVSLLSEIVSRFDAEGLAPRRTLVRSVEGNVVHAVVRGETFDPARHIARTAVKAVTYHGLRVERSDDGLSCTVILDL